MSEGIKQIDVVAKLENKEIKTSERSRMSNSSEMIKNPIKDGEPGYDKVYIMASEVKVNENNEWLINIDGNDTTVILDNKWKETLKLDNCPTVTDLRNGNGEKTLVSGGTWMWVENNDGSKVLALLMRDKEAPVDAGCFTGPAGRCGEKLSQTTIDETNQEFIFLQVENNESKKLLAFYRDESEIDSVKHQKLRQVEDVRKALMSKYEMTLDIKYKNDADYLMENIRSEKDLEMIKMDSVSNGDQKLDTIKMMIDGEVVDEVKGIAFMDEKNHTLEVREVVKVKLPEGVKMSKIMDGEVFLRDTVLVSEKDLEKLKDYPMVPALKNYIDKQVI